MGEQKHKQLTFDIDSVVTKQILGENRYTNVWKDIRKFMEKNGWKHIEGSAYMSKDPVSTVKVISTIQELKRQYPYLDKCVKEMHLTNISKVHSLDKYFDYDGTPGKYAQMYEQKENNHKKAPTQKPSVLGKLAENKTKIDAKNSERANQPVKTHEKSEHSER